METEDVNISADRLRVILTFVSALQATVWIETTAAACLKVRACLQQTSNMQTYKQINKKNYDTTDKKTVSILF